jgi:hypothetical protein
LSMDHDCSSPFAAESRFVILCVASQIGLEPALCPSIAIAVPDVEGCPSAMRRLLRQE